uniref:Uncharacterized protein n=1 Tax=Steinernema glaseri TaxID=37863 RepID=A0A1I7Z2D8_9BILA
MSLTNSTKDRLRVQICRVEPPRLSGDPHQINVALICTLKLVEVQMKLRRNTGKTGKHKEKVFHSLKLSAQDKNDGHLKKAIKDNNGADLHTCERNPTRLPHSPTHVLHAISS